MGVTVCVTVGVTVGHGCDRVRDRVPDCVCVTVGVYCDEPSFQGRALELEWIGLARRPQRCQRLSTPRAARVMHESLEVLICGPKSACAAMLTVAFTQASACMAKAAPIRYVRTRNDQDGTTARVPRCHHAGIVCQ